MSGERSGLRIPLYAALIVFLGVLLAVACLLSLLAGPMNLRVDEVAGALATRLSGAEVAGDNLAVDSVVWNLRLPRVILAVLVGAALGMAGAVMQGVFRNPLADPGVIGVAAGGALGAVLMMVAGGRALGGTAAFDLYGVPMAAMAGAILTTALIYWLARSTHGVDLVTMLLVGIAVNALGGALIGVLTYMATDDELRSMAFWGLGSLGRAHWGLLLPGLIFLVVPLILLPGYAKALNALLLGERDAACLGIDVRRVKRGAVALSAAAVGATVALCGAIGFVALVAPHIIRSVLGADHRILLPASALLGAVILLAADSVSRVIVAPAELPIGILTALLGAPVFLFLVRQRRRMGTES
ncbi:MAG: iron ABC transporter permease [Terrimicrobiaceae bacterium]